MRGNIILRNREHSDNLPSEIIMKGGLDRIHISVLPSDERHVNIISHMVGGKCANIQYTDLTTINLDVGTQVMKVAVK